MQTALSLNKDTKNPLWIFLKIMPVSNTRKITIKGTKYISLNWFWLWENLSKQICELFMPRSACVHLVSALCMSSSPRRTKKHLLKITQPDCTPVFMLFVYPASQVFSQYVSVSRIGFLCSFSSTCQRSNSNKKSRLF